MDATGMYCVFGLPVRQSGYEIHIQIQMICSGHEGANSCDSFDWTFEHCTLPETTPPKINIEPENDGLEDDFPFPVVYSQVPC